MRRWGSEIEGDGGSERRGGVQGENEGGECPKGT